MPLKEKEIHTQLYRIRHSLAHLMAEAILQMRPASKLGFGPPIEDGFYYDFFLSSPLTEDDFPEIEKRMRRLIQENHDFLLEKLDRTPALQRLDEMGEPYKKEYAIELFEKQGISQLSFYRTGDFLDMCEGPHVSQSQELPQNSFKIRSLAGAYWRGDSSQPMMTRIYAWAFESKSELDAAVKTFSLAQERDHKKLGKELEIFLIDDEIGKGLPLWLPAGTVIREELEKLMKELEFQAGFHRVVTPQLAKEALYYRSGHLPYYGPHMFPAMTILGEKSPQGEPSSEVYRLKPMNCPHHHRIFSSRLRSYRELPLRLAEFGNVYRFEDSGALSGLLRVRGMCMNDAHIYCTLEQIKDEFLKVMHMHEQVYKIFGLHSYSLRFSTWDPEDPKGKEKYLNKPEAWALTQKLIFEAMLESGIPYTEGKGEAAFYGPKIDFQLKTVTGREETASTNQLDFGMPERFDLKYVGRDGLEHRPYIIHRAPIGTHERFVAFLIEHFSGAFPTWLAPVQVKILSVSERFMEYAEKINHQLRQAWVRSEIEESADTIGKKIRNASKARIPNILILGEKEQSNSTVTLRQYGLTEQKELKIEEFLAEILKQIQSRSLDKI